MDARVNTVTIGASDTSTSQQFYRDLGFLESAGETNDERFRFGAATTVGPWGKQLPSFGFPL